MTCRRKPDVRHAASAAKADIMLSGGRSQFVALKARMPWMDINQERHHAFAGYEGMVTMIEQIDKALFNPMWQQVRTPAALGGRRTSPARPRPETAGGKLAAFDQPPRRTPSAPPP